MRLWAVGMRARNRRLSVAKANSELGHFSVVEDIGISSGGCGISRFPILCGSGVLFFFLALLL